ncbi:MAG: AbrB/MazE/SpoVT family DNA-binding domain-containing protein [Lentisphaeria bacterium]|nr:AbrB/MazE/SpoVT family DNA-binding domain-containing protein [Lentisphaeria bacterium]
MSVQTIKLTAKRQATFPAALCQDLDLRPGDRLVLEHREIDGAPAWIMRPAFGDRNSPWFGALRSFASGKSHAMDEIRRSTGKKTAEAKS